MTTAAKLLLTTAEAAALLGLSPATVRRLVRAGDLQVRRVGRLWRFTQEELRRFIEGGR